MSKRNRRSLAAVAVAVSAAALAAPVSGVSAAVATASPRAAAHADAPDAEALGHDLPGTAGERTRRARALAVAKVAAGEVAPETRGSSQRIEYKKGTYAETARTSDRIFVLPVEFTDYAHNEIPEPDRTTDNSTVWAPDYSPAYYQRQIFGTAGSTGDSTGDTLASYYRRQSSGAYSITGTVHDWTRVDHTLAHYGTDACRKNGLAISTYYCNKQLVTDGLDQWYENRRAAGLTAAALAKYLSAYDTWDRNDYDKDGIFNEPDGYLDRVMLTFAGESQANGGGVNGTDALGSHRGTVSHLQTGSATLGPANGNRDGGSEIGDSGVWANDYTMTNENRGLGTLAHEYGHDLGLPDLYDTSGGENSTGFWSVMAQGSLLSEADQLAAHPGDLGAWAKLRLGWLDHATVRAATAASVTLNPLSVDSATKGREALLVKLPADTDGNARYYLVENRQDTGEDRYLKSGPFQLGWRSTKPRLKERLHYETGALIWYWNTKYRDNRTKANGGHGQILPVDAHAEPARDTSGAVIRGRLQSYDAPFGRRPTAPLTFHLNGVETTIRSRPGVPVFRGLGGTTITVDQEYADGRMKVSVGSST
ncbi:immune inhibitor A domain-containing protein [Streptomyces sp. NPDC050704]|uniref:immune inhibitor A domain-containing protein n=1 Tax=Streptomyces sp. NPDC050704 TaxID=3157219 RepID=UPI00342BFAD3